MAVVAVQSLSENFEKPSLRRVAVHKAQFYEADAHLVRSVADYVVEALEAGGAAVVIATEAHRKAIARRLHVEGVHVSAMHAADRYIALDAARVLRKFMRDGAPDPELFKRAIEPVLERAGAGGRQIYAFGEMVALLWSKNECAAAIKLEELWNELQKDRDFSLLCAYPMRDLGGVEKENGFARVCQTHTHVIPAESTMLPKNATQAEARELASVQQKAASLSVEVAERHRAESALRDSLQVANRLAAIVEGSDDAIVGKTLDGVITSWNRGAEQLFGYTADEAIGKSVAMLIPENRPNEEPEILSRLRKGERVDHYETVRRRKDGTLLDISLTISPIKDADGVIVGASKIARDISDRKRAQQAVVESRDQLEERVKERTAELAARTIQLARLSSELTMSEQRERKRIATILHDDLQQLLVASILRLQVFSRQYKETDENPLAPVLSLLNECREVSASLTMDLSPPILHEGGLIAALNWLARDMKSKYGLQVEFTHRGGDADIPEDVRVLVYQTARELLFNAFKHSEVHKALVRLEHGADRSLRLEVSDEGRGFDAAKLLSPLADKPGGFGLFTARERCILLGGEFDCRSMPGQGSKFTLFFPGNGAG